MIRSHIKKTLAVQENNLENIYVNFKQKLPVKLSFYRSYEVNVLLKPAENNFCNWENFKKSDSSNFSGSYFFFQVPIKELVCEGLTEKSIFL